MDPQLSVVVIIVSDTVESHGDASHLAGCLEALHRQVPAPPLEIIVPFHDGIAGVDVLRAQFPAVTFVRMGDVAASSRGGREHHDVLRARGVALARAPIVGVLEDHARPSPGWAAAMLGAHRNGWAAVGGGIENGIDRALNWAVYFCDFGRYQAPLAADAFVGASDANAAYKRSALDRIRSVWERSFQETVVNAALRARGETLAMSRQAVVHQHRLNLEIANARRERFVWGRSYAATRSRQQSRGPRLALALGALVLPPLLLLRMSRTVLRKRTCRRAFLRALPLTAVLTVFWSLGECVGYITGRPTPASRIDGAAVPRPVGWS
jgi:hypothetical protein